MYPTEFAVVLIKPDAKERGLENEIYDAFKAEGLVVGKVGTIQFDVPLVLSFYQWDKLEHPEAIRNYICLEPLQVWIVTGGDAIIKSMSLKGRMRMKYYDGPLKNLFHCPSSQEESRRQFELIQKRIKL